MINPKDVITEDISLEDQWFIAEQEANEYHRQHQMLYRLKDNVLYEMTIAVMDDAVNSGGKITKTSAMEQVKSSPEWRSYITDMVEAEKAAKDKKTVSDYIEKLYYGEKQAIKSEQKVYNYHESVSKQRTL